MLKKTIKTVDDLIEKCLQFDRAQRFANISQLKEAIKVLS